MTNVDHAPLVYMLFGVGVIGAAVELTKPVLILSRLAIFLALIAAGCVATVLVRRHR